MNRPAIFVALFFLIPSFVFGFVSPGKPAGFVNDYAGILKTETITLLNQRLGNFSKETTGEVVVVTIPKLEGETIETYAEKLFQEWGIGKKGKDNGILLLVSVEDREMRMEVGYGYESLVTDIDSGRIIREILTPSFQEGKYDEGVIKAVDTIIGLIGGQEMPANSSSGQYNWSKFLPYAIFIIIYLAAILGRSKSWWAGGIIGGILGIIFYSGIILVGVWILVGLIFDFAVSRIYSKSMSRGGVPPWWIGGSGSGGGGFGGLGGGMSGGGGASGRW